MTALSGQALTTYRTIITGMAVIGVGVNIGALVALWRLHSRLGLHLWSPRVLQLSALVSLCGAAYFRLRDAATHYSFNPGDVTGLVVVVGFTLAGILTIREAGHAVGRLDGEIAVREVKAPETHEDERG